MSKANLSICASTRKIKIGQQASQATYPIITAKKIKLPAYSETLVPLKVNGSFLSALIEGSSSLPEGICLRKGIVTVANNTCNAIFANFTRLPVSIPAYSSVAQLDTGQLTAMPIDSCLATKTLE